MAKKENERQREAVKRLMFIVGEEGHSPNCLSFQSGSLCDCGYELGVNEVIELVAETGQLTGEDLHKIAYKLSPGHYQADG